MVGDVCNLFIYESLMHLIIVHELNVLENTKWAAASCFFSSRCGFYKFLEESRRNSTCDCVWRQVLVGRNVLK